MFNLQSKDNEDYLYESYFVVLGLTGAGKSSFINAISNSDKCFVSRSVKSVTQIIQLVSFVYNDHRFNAIDTPGLDDSEGVGEKIKILNKVLKEFPKIKKLIIVKKYNDLRFPENIQNALINFMNAFPLRDFWEHVIIVNSWANPCDESFQDYLEERRESFSHKIHSCKNLLQIMRQKGINQPTFIKEYFVCSKNAKKNREIQNILNEIKKDIKNSLIMFKNILLSNIKERSIESKRNSNLFIITKYRTITCVDFNEYKTESEEILEEKEVNLKDCKIAYTREESEFLEDDEVKFYDVLSFGIARAIRNTKKYRIYRVNYHQVGDKIIKGDRIFDRIEYR